jgi:hypothetical protein
MLSYPSDAMTTLSAMDGYSLKELHLLHTKRLRS